MNYATLHNDTNQREKAHSAQIKNSAGGFSFTVNDEQRLRRFLILGTEDGSYYADERKLTKENTNFVQGLVQKNSRLVVDTILDVSLNGKAYKQEPTLFALALVFAYGDTEAKRYAEENFERIVRTGTMLFTFVEYVNSLRGFGRSLSRAISRWYANKDEQSLAYQIAKYQHRGGWSHRDVLRKVHYGANTPVLRYAVGAELGERSVDRKLQKGEYRLVGQAPVKYPAVGELPAFLQAVEEVKTASPKRLIQLISEFDLPMEVIPTDKRTPEVWEAILDVQLNKNLMTAMIRNLATLTRQGVIAPLSKASTRIREALQDVGRLKRARIHPIQILAAQLTYAAGRSERGSNTWTPVQPIVDALNEAFYLTFDNVERIGGGVVLGLDVSGSMGSGTVGGVLGLSPRIASAALALITARTEPDHVIIGFTGGGSGYGWYGSTSRTSDTKTVSILNISPKMRLEEVVRTVSNLPFGATDCALPMIWAQENKVQAQGFAIYTDSETWAGRVHPHVALKNYQKAYNPNARVAVVGMVSSNFSIAEKDNPSMMDVVGFSTDTPKVINEFLARRL